jgi:hypothetical protein
MPDTPDLGPLLPPAGGLSAEGLADVLCADQRDRWLRGERPPAELYLRHYRSRHPGPEFAVDLVFNEFLLRRRLGEAPSLEEYGGRFPELAEELRLQVQLYDALGWGEPVAGAAGPGDGPPPPSEVPAATTPDFEPDYRSFQRLLLDMAQERSLAALLRLIVNRLAERPSVALARVWLLRPGDVCATCRMRPECRDRTACLHLAASAGRPLLAGEDWSRLNGAFRRMPLGVRKVGSIAARGEAIEVADLQVNGAWLASPDWARREGLHAFGGQPLVYNGQVLGVLAVFFRALVAPEVMMWLRLLADHAAAALANAQASEEIERLRTRVAADTGGHAAGGLPPGEDWTRLGPLLFAKPSPPAEPAVWPKLPGYEILGELGRGGMAIVYKARQLSLRRVVAVKVVALNRAGERGVVARFHQERLLSARLAHPNLVQAYDAGQVAGLPYFVMEFIDGASLAQLVERGGPLPVAEACEAARQAALGLQHIHENGLVHRDVKPSNLMVTPGGRVKVLDLGLARLLGDPAEEGALTAHGHFLGTLDYVAPEQCTDSRSVDVRADVYSLGCTLYHLLAGQPPFAAPAYDSAFQKMKAHVEARVPPLGERRPDVPGPLAAALERMLAKGREGRFATPAEAAAALGPFAAGADLPGLLRHPAGRSA